MDDKEMSGQNNADVTKPIQSEDKPAQSGGGWNIPMPRSRNPHLDIGFASPGGRMLRDVLHDENNAANIHINRVVARLQERGEIVNPFVADYFRDEHLYNALPDNIRTNDEELAAYIIHSGRLADSLNRAQLEKVQGQANGLYGESVTISDSKHHDGSARREESGSRLNLDYLRAQGIDPRKVLFFRISQPGDAPKPEYYWTTDYFETQRGLQVEVRPAQRETAIILVADMETINENGGLMDDINDDNGLAVRQIGLGAFDQNRAITSFSYKTGLVHKPNYPLGTEAPEQSKSPMVPPIPTAFPPALGTPKDSEDIW